MTFVNQVFSFNHVINMNIIKSLCMAVWLITLAFCLGSGDVTWTGTRSGKSSHKYLFVFLSYLSISAIFTWSTHYVYRMWWGRSIAEVIMYSLSTDVCGMCGSLRRCNNEGNSFCTSHTLVWFDDAKVKLYVLKWC